jgi:hypothetical protein
MPTTIEEKYKLKLQASFCLGEEVKTATTDLFIPTKKSESTAEDEKAKRPNLLA